MKPEPEGTGHAGVSAAGTRPLDALFHILDKDARLAESIIPFSTGQTILGEGERKEKLWILLEGELQLIKQTADGGLVRLDRLGPGEVVGIISYYTGEPGFFGVEATRCGKLLALSWKAYEELEHDSPETFDHLRRHISHSSMERYRRLVRLHLELEHSNQALNRERGDLQKTITELQHTRERLIHREKLATIGSIVPGIAHELNNPAASLARNADYLEAILQGVFAGRESSPGTCSLWQAGLHTALPDTRVLRSRMEELHAMLPALSRPLLRRLAAIPTQNLQIPADSSAKADSDYWENILHAFEAGRSLHVVRSATQRIERMVQSLKRYTRPGVEASEGVRLRDGIEDTLLILGSLLRDIEVRTEFNPIPGVHANADELNQVWTNLIVNAVEAMNGRGFLAIECGKDKHGRARVTVADSGPGIHPDKREILFEPHYTTKAKGGDFGLGLGLSLSRMIIEKYGGEIHAEANDPQGARFVITLPADKPSAAKPDS